MEVLKMAGFDQIFSFHHTMEDAMEYPLVPENSAVDWGQLLKYDDEHVLLTILEVSQILLH
jgi:hypothetical protein